MTMLLDLKPIYMKNKTHIYIYKQNLNTKHEYSIYVQTNMQQKYINN